MYCDMTTPRDGTLGWMLLAVVSNNSNNFWTGYTATSNAVNTTKGSPSPTLPNNYLLSLRDWTRFAEIGRTIVVEVSQTSSTYSLAYHSFRLSSTQAYLHAPGNVWQTGDPNDGINFVGTFYPWTGAGAQCSSGGLGPNWWGQCGFGILFQSDGAGKMFHPISSAGVYVNPAVNGVTSKLFWMQ